MKKLSKNLLLVVLLCLAQYSFSQKLTTTWSEQYIEKNKTDGFFSGYIGENDKYIYCYNNNISFISQMRLVCIDKTTLKRVAVYQFLGTKQFKTEKRKYKGLRYYQTLITNSGIFSFYKSDDKGSSKLLVKLLSPELKEVKGLKVLSSRMKVSTKKNKQAYPFIETNQKSDKIFLGIEQETAPGEKIKLEYQLLDQKLKVSRKNEVVLPIVYSGPIKKRGSGSRGQSASYTYGDDGNIHFRTTVSENLGENASRKARRKAKSHEILGIINLKKNKLNYLPIEFEDKSFFSLKRLVTEDGTRIYGFYTDKTIKTKYRETHGLFYGILNSDYKFTTKKFNKFNTQMIRKLFKGDKNDVDGGSKGGGCLPFSRKKSTHAKDGTLDNDYIIETSIDGPDGAVYLFANKMVNRQNTVCTTDQNGNTSCTTYYYCDKGNVTSFKLNKSGDIEWYSNHDRAITYSGNYIYDLSVIEDENGFYAVYGDRKNSHSRKKNPLVFWKSQDNTFPLEYIYIEKATGKVKVLEMKLNDSTTPNKEAKMIVPVKIRVINNKMYLTSSFNTLAPGHAARIFCTGGCFLPVLMVKAKVGYTYYGTLEPAVK